jgi:segregation and condensation protein B
VESSPAAEASGDAPPKLTLDAVDTRGPEAATLTPAEAALRLGVARPRIYALVRQGALDDVGTDTLRVTRASVERRLAASRPVGEPIKPLGAWAILALASSDAAFRAHVASRITAWEQSRAKRRLQRRSLFEIAPRLRNRGVARRYTASAESLLAVLEDARGVLAATSAARHFEWPLPDGDWPVELYVPESDLVDMVETHGLEFVIDQPVDVVLRAVPDAWPFPPHLRVAPELVAALDLAEAVEPCLAALGRARLADLTDGLEPSWRRRPQRRRPLRPIVPSSTHSLRPHARLQHSTAAEAAWDDQAEREARGLVALLHVAGGVLRRAELAAALRVSTARVDRACAFLRASPPHGLALLESGGEIQLVSAPDCGPLVERFLDKPPPEPLSQAALEVLSIVAYEQPVTRAEISHIRATDSSGVIETLLARGLIADDPLFGGRGRPSFLVTTTSFLRLLGLGSLAELPPRPVP